jgi:hypothetical protein
MKLLTAGIREKLLRNASDWNWPARPSPTSSPW